MNPKILILIFLLSIFFQPSNSQSKKYKYQRTIYAGVYVLPLFAKSDRRDYGGTLNYLHHNLGVELSFLKINNKKENIYDMQIKSISAKQDDLPRWNGYYVHLQPKIFDYEHNEYLGLLLGFAEKNFPSFSTSIVNNVSQVQSSTIFRPHVSSYFAMINTGRLLSKKILFSELYAGFGFHYSFFKNGSSINNKDYYIDNPILRNRKDSYLGVMMRCGLTIGLGYKK